jgi:hypothetical protein
MAEAVAEPDEVTGGTPYSASTLAGGDGSRAVSANELDGARLNTTAVEPAVVQVVVSTCFL